MVTKFKELSKAKIKENKNLIISKVETGGFAIAQQIEFNEDGRRIGIFLKGAIITNEEGLIDIRDAINEALEKVQNG